MSIKNQCLTLIQQLISLIAIFLLSLFANFIIYSIAKGSCEKLQNCDQNLIKNQKKLYKFEYLFLANLLQKNIYNLIFVNIVIYFVIICEKNKIRYLLMFLKNKKNNPLNKLSHQQKVKYLERVTKVSLNNLKTNIIQSDFEEEDQDNHYPLSMYNFIQCKQKNCQGYNKSNAKIIQQKKQKKQKKQKHVSLEQKLNKSIKNMTKQLYAEQTNHYKQQNIQLLDNKQKFNSNLANDQQCYSSFNLDLDKNQNKRKQKLAWKSYGQQQHTINNCFEKQINRQKLLNITFIPLSRMTKRISQPLKQIAIRSNIFMTQKDLSQEGHSRKQNIKQVFHYQANVQTKKQKFNRSNRKSYNQINKQNIDKKIYSIKKEQDKSLLGWITKRQISKINQNLLQKNEENKKTFERKPMKQILLQVQKKQIKIINKDNLNDRINTLTQKNESLEKKSKEIRNHHLYSKLTQCQDIQKIKQFCKLLLNWYQISQNIKITNNNQLSKMWKN